MKPFIVVDGVCYISEAAVRDAMVGKSMTGDGWSLSKDGEYKFALKSDEAAQEAIRDAAINACRKAYQVILGELNGKPYAMGFSPAIDSSQLSNDENQPAAGQETTQRNDSPELGASQKQETENDPYPGAENVLELLDWIKRQVSSSQLSSNLKSKL